MANSDMSQTPEETVICQNRNWFSIDWKDIWRHRDLLFLLVRRDFVAKYKQTILGPLWFIINPLITTIVFTIFFGNVLKVPTDNLPPILFYLCALVPWSYFSLSIGSISNSLQSNSYLFSKVYFPRLIIPFSILFSNLIMLVIQFGTFLGLYFYFLMFTSQKYLIHPSPPLLLLLPFLIFYTAAVALGFGLWVAALTVKYRDFQNMIGFLVQLWMYATPIIYPVSVIPEKWRIVLGLNPLAGIVESFRFVFFGTGYVRLDYFCLSITMTLIILLSGLFYFNKVERTFVDTI